MFLKETKLCLRWRNTASRGNSRSQNTHIISLAAANVWPWRHDDSWPCSYNFHVVVTCEMKIFPNYFSFRRGPSEIILFQRVKKTCLKLFHNYFRDLLQLGNIFQHAQCRWNNFEMVLELLQRIK